MMIHSPQFNTKDQLLRSQYQREELSRTITHENNHKKGKERLSHESRGGSSELITLQILIWIF